MSNLYNRLLMPCLCVAAVCQAVRRIREISCTWMRKQGLPLGHWLGHKHPFNRLTPHFAPKAGWRVPGGRETEHTDGGEVEVSSLLPPENQLQRKTGIWLARPSRPEGDRPEQCGVFPFRNNRGIMSELSLVWQGKKYTPRIQREVACADPTKHSTYPGLKLSIW